MSPIITPAGSGSQPVQVANVTLTDAQVKALPTTPVQIVAAPGAASIVVPLHATLRLAWTANYTGIDTNAKLFLENGTGLSSSQLDEGINNAVSGLLAGGGPDGGVAWVPEVAIVPASAGSATLNGYSGNFDSDVANKAILLAASNPADFTGGNAANALKVTLLYYVVAF